MIRIKLFRLNKLTFLFLLLGLTILFTQTSYAQRKRIRQASLDDYMAGPGEKTAAERIKEEEARKKKKAGRTKPDADSKNKSDDCEGTLSVNIAASPSVVHVGKAYTFVALSKGGCKGTYKYMWSGTNLNTGNHKMTGLLNRNSMTASFKNLGTSTISVAVVDAKNHKDSDRVVVKVVP